jgi:tRNA(Ile2)-agmatinylcytidine synthase
MGRGKGFKCEKCGKRYVGLEKVAVRVKREVQRGLYITSPRSQRHLTKPFIRYGMEKCRIRVVRLIDGWHYP